MQTKLLINGEMVAGTGEAMPVMNPSTGEEIARINAAGKDQVEAATQAAAEAFETYGRSTPAERAAHLHAIADVIEANIEELAELETLDVGKPWPMSRDEEMPLSIDTFRFMAGAARTMPGSATAEYVADHTSMIRRDPIGPIAAIAPWNYPLMMAAWKIAAPLAARLRYGMTWVNTHGVPTAEMPWAAMKGSGTGCDMSVYALDAYTAVRHVMVAH